MESNNQMNCKYNQINQIPLPQLSLAHFCHFYHFWKIAFPNQWNPRHTEVKNNQE